jgi:hypothetical protein
MSYTIDAFTGRISIGNQNEKNSTVITIDVSAWLTLYPGATFSITYTREGESDVYPADGVSLSGNTLTWTVGKAVTAISGQGTAVVHCTLGDIEKCSAMAYIITAPGHDAAGDAPEPIQDYITEMAGYAHQAVEAAALLTGVELSVNVTDGTLEIYGDSYSPIDIVVNDLDLEVYSQ